MDPLTRAGTAFKKDLLAWLYPSPLRRDPKELPASARMVVSGASPKDVASTLRWAELDPACRHPFFVLDGPFEGMQAFLREAHALFVRDEAALRKGLAEDGMVVPEVSAGAAFADETALAAVLAKWGAAVGQVLSGLLVALAPSAVRAEADYQKLTQALVARAQRTKLMVLLRDFGDAATEGMVPYEVRCEVDSDALAKHLANLGNPTAGGAAPPAKKGPPGIESGNEPVKAGPSRATGASLRRLLVEAGELLSKGRFAEGASKLRAARMLCFLSGLPKEEAVVSVSLGTALFGAGDEERALAAFARGRQVALAEGSPEVAAQACMGVGAVHVAKKRVGAAEEAYAEAAKLAEGLPPLREEAERMLGTCRGLA